MNDTELIFDDAFARKITLKANELYLRDHHPYEFAALIFEELINFKETFTSLYQKKIEYFCQFFELQRDFLFTQRNAQLRQAKSSICAKVMMDDELDDPLKRELIESLSDPYELIDRLMFMYRATKLPTSDFVNLGVIHNTAVNNDAGSGNTDSGEEHFV